VTSPEGEQALLQAARDDDVAFACLVEPYRAELHAHWYRSSAAAPSGTTCSPTAWSTSST
jgi:hypothetical protein